MSTAQYLDKGKWVSIVGLDLAGVENRPTGYCLLREFYCKTALFYKNDEIIAKIEKAKPLVVGIDAPLSLPPDKKTIHDRGGKHLRESDRLLLKNGIKIFPATLGPMRKLTERGIYLRNILQGKHFAVIEVYPGGAQDVLGIPRKKQSLSGLKAGLEKLGITGLGDNLSDHELDAATCAFIGKLFLDGKTVTYGSQNDGIVMPIGKKQES